MKLSKITLFILIWVVHLFVYYTVYIISIKIMRNDYNEFYTVFIGFIGGIIGWFEQIPFFVLIPIALMLVLVKTKFSEKWFIAYALSCSTAYLGNYLWMFLRNTHDKILFSPESINLIYFILPSLVISIFCNWLIFRKQYKRLGA